MGNIRSRSRARANSKVTEGHPQTASILSEAAANNAEYERNVIQASKDAAKVVVSFNTLNLRLGIGYSFPFLTNDFISPVRALISFFFGFYPAFPLSLFQ